MYRIELILSIPEKVEEQQECLKELEDIILDCEESFIVLPGRAISLDYGIRFSQQCIIYFIDLKKTNSRYIYELIEKCIEKYDSFSIRSIKMLKLNNERDYTYPGLI